MKPIPSQIDIIRQRYSCRNYQKQPIAPVLQQRLRSFLQKLPAGPFGSRPRFNLVAASKTDTQALKGLGTYGFIRNPAGFIVGAMQSSDRGLEDYGYLLESAIIEVTAMGLGTCWLGGSFSKSQFAGAIDRRPDETVPAVVAVGYPADKTRAFESVIRWGMKAKKRKAWSELFFQNRFHQPLSPKEAGTYSDALEMVRLGPSASNRQPWRVVFSPETPAFHFFLQRSRGYYQRNKRLFGMADLQRVDMGIAMCHFEQTCQASGRHGRWQMAGPTLDRLPPLTEYLTSWVATKK